MSRLPLVARHDSVIRLIRQPLSFVYAWRPAAGGAGLASIRRDIGFHPKNARSLHEIIQ